MNQRRHGDQLVVRKRGSMIVEAAVGLVIAAFAMIAIAQLVALLARQRAETAQMRLAAQEAANIMEQVMQRPWDELTAASVEAIALSAESQRGLTAPQLTVEIEIQDGPPPAKRVEVRLDWSDRAGNRVQPVQVVAWKYQIGSQE